MSSGFSTGEMVIMCILGHELFNRVLTSFSGHITPKGKLVEGEAQD